MTEAMFNRLPVGKPVNAPLLAEQLSAAFPGLFAMQEIVDDVLYISFDLSIDPAAVQAVIDAHDASLLSRAEQMYQMIVEARGGANNLPEWSAWSAQEAANQVTGRVFNGMTKAEANAWIDANITGTTLAALRTQTITAFKQVAGAVIDLRIICANMAKLLMWLRDIVVKAVQQ